MAKKGRWRAWVFLVCWIALTCFAMTYDFHPGRMERVLEHGGDKIIHTTLFTVMGISAQAAAPWISLLVQFDMVDMLANITGIFLGLFAYELSTRLSR
jgi:hypothetical protein